MKSLESLLACSLVPPFADEHVRRLAARMEAFHRDGVPAGRPLPHFAAEITPPLEEAFAPFRPALAEPSEESIARAVASAGFANVLILLGMRMTPASLTGHDGVPPTVDRLLDACEEIHNPSDGLTVAARAWAKHVHRSPEAFWGVCEGGVSDKNAGARALIERILNETTWWNVFGHYQHEFVYEARVSTGHGARWGQRGDTFIGFLEPFDAAKCPSLRESEE